MGKWDFLCWLIVRCSGSHPRLVRRLRRLRERVSREIDRFEATWEIAIERPKFFHGGVASILPQDAPVAVVIQGPIVEEDAFTLETVKLYRATFPASPLIVSTWSDAPPQVLRELSKLGATTITSTAPEVPGPVNLNLQVRSTSAGLRVAKELGATFALKTRSDMRLYSAHVADFLAGLWRAFPLQTPGRQRGRLIVLDLVTRLFIPNHPSDLLMFGHVDDLLDYWSLPLRDPDEQLSQTRFFGEFLSDPIPEVLLCEHYLEMIGERPQRTIEEWWRVLANRFLVVDRESMQVFWRKYNYGENHRLSEDDQVRNFRLCRFCDWINLFSAAKRPPFEIESLAQCRRNERLFAA